MNSRGRPKREAALEDRIEGSNHGYRACGCEAANRADVGRGFEVVNVLVRHAGDRRAYNRRRIELCRHVDLWRARQTACDHLAPSAVPRFPFAFAHRLSMVIRPPALRPIIDEAS